MAILINQKVFENNKTKIFNLDGYFRIAYNNYWHDGQGNSPDDRLKNLILILNL